MKSIMELKESRKARLLQHAFFRWVQSEGLPAERRLLFAPIMLSFVMAFRDANKYFIRFPSARTRYEEIINICTIEDETHSALFLEDWRRLGLDAKTGWRASDALYWLYMAKETEPIRRAVIEMAALTVRDGGDAFARFAHTEAGEACGNAFFSVLAPIADQASQETGLTYRYFGEHHLQKEPGHVIDSPGVFEHLTLTESQRALALTLATRMFDLFEGLHDCFFDYARLYVQANRYPTRPRAERMAAQEYVKMAPTAPSPHPSQLPIFEALEARKAKASQHPFFAWLRSETRISAKQKLLRVVPLWIVDILGYRDLNAYAIRYPEPRSEEEAEVCAICDDLQTHGALFLDDWDALGMDALLGWSASETIAFCFLDPAVEVHRKNLATFLKLALGDERPALRYWLLQALEASGHGFFEATRKLALEVEQEDGIVLNYLADRHEIAHKKRISSMPPRIPTLPLNDEARAAAIAAIDAVFDALEEQLCISLEAGRDGRVLASRKAA